MAVHGGLRAREAGGAAKPGLLVALRGVQLHAARIDHLPGTLECEAEVLVEAEGSQHYGFRIHPPGTLLPDARDALLLGAPAYGRLPPPTLSFYTPPSTARRGSCPP